jgi:hypothetical protein
LKRCCGNHAYLGGPLAAAAGFAAALGGAAAVVVAATCPERPALFLAFMSSVTLRRPDVTAVPCEQQAHVSCTMWAAQGYNKPAIQCSNAPQLQAAVRARTQSAFASCKLRTCLQQHICCRQSIAKHICTTLRNILMTDSGYALLAHLAECFEHLLHAATSCCCRCWLTTGALLQQQLRQIGWRRGRGRWWPLCATRRRLSWGRRWRWLRHSCCWCCCTSCCHCCCYAAARRIPLEACGHVDAHKSLQPSEQVLQHKTAEPQRMFLKHAVAAAAHNCAANNCVRSGGHMSGSCCSST